jgi:hypothetical protein|nr:MAG TPA: Structural protein sp46 [Caudoviricetes sp.]
MKYQNDFQPTATVGGFYLDSDKGYNDGLTQTLESVQAAFQLSPVHHLSNILQSRPLKEQYKEKLMENYINGLPQDRYYGLHAEKLDQLFENTATDLLIENSVAQLSPVVGLTFPVLTKSYAESISKDIVMTEVATQPVVKKQFERKFIKDRQGNKYYYPEIFYNDDWKKVQATARGKAMPNAFYPSGADKLFEKPIFNFNLLGEAGGALDKGDSFSYDLCISAVQITVKDATGTGTSLQTFPVDIRARVDEDHVAHARVTGYGLDSDKTPVSDELVFIVDWQQGTVSVNSLGGKVEKVKFGGHLSNQLNTETMSVDKEREGFVWNMEEGVRLNTGVTIERIKDTKALVGTDHVAEVVSEMSSIITQLEDNDVLDQLKQSFEHWKTIDERSMPLGYDARYVMETKFDCNPVTNSYKSTAEYVGAELQFLVTRFINDLKMILKETDLMFVMHGHPSCIDLVTMDIDWIISSNSEKQMGGLSLGYKFGITTNNGTQIHVVSSAKEKKADGIMLTAYALTENVFTFKNWKYSMNIENTYRNPMAPNIPNIMATSRYKFASLQAVQGKIGLVNNNYGIGAR